MIELMMEDFRAMLGTGIIGVALGFGAIFLYYVIKQHKEDDDGWG